ncbi:MAG: hypothetical protein MUO82_00705, partial [Candidatus Thermoplasmatota archaeon]|nr:hypothetical protein [Candidatus Thermoplasmatota archaeon]
NRIIAAKTGSSQFWRTMKLIIDPYGLQHEVNKTDEELRQLSPENILKADKVNFDMPYHEINKIEIKKNFNDFIYIRIYTYKKRLIFFIKKEEGKNAIIDLINLLKSVLSNKLFIDKFFEKYLNVSLEKRIIVGKNKLKLEKIVTIIGCLFLFLLFIWGLWSGLVFDVLGELSIYMIIGVVFFIIIVGITRIFKKDK